MKEISNKTIFLLLLVTLLITLGGTIVSINKLLSSEGYGIITSAATSNATGTASVSISTTTSITNNAATIDFGSGYVNSSCSQCRMDSDVGQAGVTCCVSFNNVTSGFLLENTGNINISVNYVCAFNCTADSLVGGTKPMFEIKWTANNVSAQSGEVGSLDTHASCGGRGKLNSTYENISAAGKFICGNSSANYSLDFNNSQDAFVVDINLTIPVDAPFTNVARSAVFTFNASSSA